MLSKSGNNADGLDTLALIGSVTGLVVFIVGGLRVSARNGLFRRSLLANVGLSRQERAAQRKQFWDTMFAPGAGLERWLIFGGAALCAGSLLALNALVG